MTDSTDDAEYRDAIAERKLEYQTRVERLVECYTDYPDWMLIEEVIRCGKGLNNAVPDNGFPAFDIASELHYTAKKPTPRQRRALINVMARYKTKW